MRVFEDWTRNGPRHGVRCRIRNTRFLEIEWCFPELPVTKALPGVLFETWPASSLGFSLILWRAGRDGFPHDRTLNRFRFGRYK
jgi:hypothetical protein